MTEIQFPFQLTNAFFTSLQFRRVPEVPDPLNLNIAVQVRIHDEQFPDKLQIDLRIETPSDQPLALQAELVGLFALVENRPRPSDQDILREFVNGQALYMLWPYMVQMVRQMTAQMGMNPVTILTPSVFKFEPPGQTSQSTPSQEGSSRDT